MLPDFRLAPKMAHMKYLDPDTEAAVRNFLSRVPADLRIERAILYGSRARGEHKPDMTGFIQSAPFDPGFCETSRERASHCDGIDVRS